MKVEVVDEYKTIVYLYNFDELDYDVKSLEKYFKSIFLKLKDLYEVNVTGFFNVDVYVDNMYGIVLVIEREKMEYFSYYDNQVNMQINISNNNEFLYEVEDPYLNIEAIKNIYLYKSRYFAQIEEKIDNIRLGQLLEFGKLVYNENTDNIKRQGKLLKLMI